MNAASVTMEHRCGQRRPADLSATLAAPSRGILCPAVVLDLSSSGVAVQTDPSVWRPLDRVSLSFKPEDPEPYRVLATVARVTRDGIGLAFDAFHPGIERALALTGAGERGGNPAGTIPLSVPASMAHSPDGQPREKTV